MAKKETGLSVKVSDEKLALLDDFPVEKSSFNRTILPRLAFKSQDVTEGVGKAKKVVIPAGTFFIEEETEELDENSGKPIWTSVKDGTARELGDTIEGVIVFNRKKLRYFDQSTESSVSTPVYDDDEEVLPLFKDGAEIGRGTPAELRAEWPGGKTAKGKDKSLLDDHRVLYIFFEGVLYELTLKGSSMYEYFNYLRQKVAGNPSKVITQFTSTPEENGGIEWNKMRFEAKRPLTAKEVDMVIETKTALKDAIAQEKAFYAGQQPAERDPLQDDMDALPSAPARPALRGRR